MKGGVRGNENYASDGNIISGGDDIERLPYADLKVNPSFWTENKNPKVDMVCGIAEHGQGDVEYTRVQL